MRELTDPIANRGPEALQLLLTTGAAAAHEQLRSLTMSELVDIAEAADQLARIARLYTDRLCGVCGEPIAWHTDPPTGQARRWRHVDQQASYVFGAHRAAPGGEGR
jgi:hypothetical protein